MSNPEVTRIMDLVNRYHSATTADKAFVWKDCIAIEIEKILDDRNALLHAIRLWMEIHESAAGFEGKYGKELDEAIAAQQARVDAAVAASRAANPITAGHTSKTP